MSLNSINVIPGAECFTQNRVTVGMVLVTPDHHGVVLVQSVKGGDFQWILPQGGVRKGKSFHEEFLRELKEEFTGAAISGAMPFLGDYVNRLPQIRGKLKKHIFWFGALLSSVPTGVNLLENRDFCIVRRGSELSSTICATRPEKQAMILQVVGRLQQTGMLQWEHPVSVSTETRAA